MQVSTTSPTSPTSVTLSSPSSRAPLSRGTSPQANGSNAKPMAPTCAESAPLALREGEVGEGDEKVMDEVDAGGGRRDPGVWEGDDESSLNPPSLASRRGLLGRPYTLHPEPCTLNPTP